MRVPKSIEQASFGDYSRKLRRLELNQGAPLKPVLIGSVMARSAIIVAIGLILTFLSLGSSAAAAGGCHYHHTAVIQVTDVNCTEHSSQHGSFCPMPGMCAPATCISMLGTLDSPFAGRMAAGLVLRPRALARLQGMNLPPPLAPPRASV